MCKCLDLCIGQCRIIHIFTGPDRGFTGHDLADELLLVLQNLPHVRIKCIFRNVPEDLYLLILVSLS